MSTTDQTPTYDVTHIVFAEAERDATRMEHRLSAGYALWDARDREDASDADRIVAGLRALTHAVLALSAPDDEEDPR